MIPSMQSMKGSDSLAGRVLIRHKLHHSYAVAGGPVEKGGAGPDRSSNGPNERHTHSALPFSEKSVVSVALRCTSTISLFHFCATPRLRVVSGTEYRLPSTDTMPSRVTRRSNDRTSGNGPAGRVCRAVCFLPRNLCGSNTISGKWIG